MKIGNMSPTSGRMLKEDGTYVNVADILGGENTGLTRDIENFSPMSGRMIKEDGTVVNIAENIGGGVTPEQIQAAVDQYLEENPVSADLPQVDHGTAGTTFALPPNQYHTWGEVAALTLTLAAEEAGVVNEYHFAFDSGTTATTLSLPEGIQTDIVVEPSTHYECSIIDNYMTFRDWFLEVSA